MNNLDEHERETRAEKVEQNAFVIKLQEQDETIDKLQAMVMDLTAERDRFAREIEGLRYQVQVTGDRLNEAIRERDNAVTVAVDLEQAVAALRDKLGSVLRERNDARQQCKELGY